MHPIFDQTGFWTHDLQIMAKVMSSNPGQVELGVRSTYVLSRTWSKHNYCMLWYGAVSRGFFERVSTFPSYQTRDIISPEHVLHRVSRDHYSGAMHTLLKQSAQLGGGGGPWRSCTDKVIQKEDWWKGDRRIDSSIPFSHSSVKLYR